MIPFLHAAWRARILRNKKEVNVGPSCQRYRLGNRVNRNPLCGNGLPRSGARLLKSVESGGVGLRLNSLISLTYRHSFGNMCSYAG
jgi:hypothetical protein